MSAEQDQRQAYQLAVDVLAMLNLQQQDFKTRNPETLDRCRTAERKMRTRCNEIIHPMPPEKPKLFPEPGEGMPD